MGKNKNYVALKIVSSDAKAVYCSMRIKLIHTLKDASIKIKEKKLSDNMMNKKYNSLIINNKIIQIKLYFFNIVVAKLILI